MGLGAPKRRDKLSHDPNNTAWSRSTENYGHRILSSQGWKPGDYLGAEAASHAAHYTAANASHIRVLLREDNLGLGAKIGPQGNAETFGLSTLSGIFGRLNGKSEVEVQKQQSNLRDAELRTYQSRKYGFMNFVRGGLLVGDKIEEVPKQAPRRVELGQPDQASTGKKRKAQEDVPKKTVKKKRKSDDLRAEVLASEVKTKDMAAQQTEAMSPHNRGEVEPKVGDAHPEVSKASDVDESSKEARRRRKEERRAKRAQQQLPTEVSIQESDSKKEKRASKEERRKRKEQKRRLKSQTKAAEDATSGSTTPSVAEVVSSGVSTPTQASLAFGGSRHVVRQRYIQQKRLASMDPRALNEILMIKAQS